MVKQTFNVYDSEKLLKEKFNTVGFIFSKGDLTLQEINNQILTMAKKDFLTEIQEKMSFDFLFSEDGGKELLEIYRKYFSVSDDLYSVEYFLRHFLEPKNYSSSYVENNKNKILKKFNQFNEDTFSEKDFSILKDAYVYNLLYEEMSGSSWVFRGTLPHVYGEYFKRTRLGTEWKSNAKVRKTQKMFSYLGILDNVDKIEAIDEFINDLNLKIEIEENNRYYYSQPYKTIKENLEKKREELVALIS